MTFHVYSWHNVDLLCIKAVYTVEEDKTARQARLQVLKCNTSQRLKNEDKTATQARLQVLKCNASQRLKKEDKTARQARLPRRPNTVSYTHLTLPTKA